MCLYCKIHYIDAKFYVNLKPKPRTCWCTNPTFVAHTVEKVSYLKQENF